MAFVAGRKRVPRPAAGTTALRTEVRTGREVRTGMEDLTGTEKCKCPHTLRPFDVGRLGRTFE
ncbi:hypothetical protein GCM10010361_27390 [Streptomyces olivaceiscleroticus]|uniref:Uncharacterized protein n=1 Tax=Streptomyces olivaceiscleroticus TaxID=68245 RepID=A0ABN0ZYG6_9ACTN